MYIHVEPKDGSEIDRLATALLNATGVVKNLIEATPVSVARDGAEAMGLVAGRLAGSLTVLAEHHDDDELATVTGMVAYVALLVAQDLGIADCFFPGDDD